MQQPTKIDFLRHSLTYGAITGAAMALASFLTELVTGKVAFGGLLIYVVMSIGILIGQKAWTMLLLPNKTSLCNRHSTGLYVAWEHRLSTRFIW